MRRIAEGARRSGRTARADPEPVGEPDVAERAGRMDPGENLPGDLDDAPPHGDGGKALASGACGTKTVFCCLGTGHRAQAASANVTMLCRRARCIFVMAGRVPAIHPSPSKRRWLEPFPL